MKTRFLQKSIGWCTVYTTANLFDESMFITFCEDEKFKGCGDDEQNELLNTYNMKIGSVAYVNQNYGQLPIDLIWSILNSETLTDECHYVPYYMSVRRLSHRKDLWHSVGVAATKHGLFYTDPYFEEWIKLESPEQLSSFFIDCHLIQRPYRIEDNLFAIIHGRQGWIEELIGYELTT